MDANEAIDRFVGGDAWYAASHKKRYLALRMIIDAGDVPETTILQARYYSIKCGLNKRVPKKDQAPTKIWREQHTWLLPTLKSLLEAK